MNTQFRSAKVAKIISKLKSEETSQFDRLQKSISVLNSCIEKLALTIQSNTFNPKQLNKKENYEKNTFVQNTNIMSNLEQISVASNRTLYKLTDSFQLQKRFQQVNIPVPEVIRKSTKQEELLRWMGQVSKIVFSVGFNLFQQSKLSENSVKVYCSENILRNIIRFSQVHQLSPQNLQQINEAFQNQILPYFLMKYPQSQQKQANKKFMNLLIQRDYTTQNNIDIIHKSGVKFELSSDGNYNSEIMRLFNYIIKTPNQFTLDKNIDDRKTLYQSFQHQIQKIFKKIQSEDQLIRMLKFQPKDSNKPDQNNIQHSRIVKSSLQQERKQFQYRQKIKSYTNYKIGTKLSVNLELFTNFQIMEGNLSFRNSAIMRVATKFCEQLQKCFQPKQILQRESPFRTKDGGQRYLNKFQKQFLNLLLQRQKKQIERQLQNIQKNNFSHQSQFSVSKVDNKLQILTEGQSIVGKFSAILFKLNQNYLINYLNLLLHGINKAAIDFGRFRDYIQGQPNPNQRMNELIKIANESYSQRSLEMIMSRLSQFLLTPQNALSEIPQLISFKIGDLIRCKCVSKENQILAIYKQIEKINLYNPRFLKIIRLKNRLNMGNKDILMNVLYKQTVLTEIQLTIKSQQSKFIQCSNSFNHYIYELKRSKFGPISQMCNIWISQDSRSSFYLEKLNEINRRQNKKGQKICLVTDRCCMDNVNSTIMGLPFTCNTCKCLYYRCSSSQKHKFCAECKRSTCFICQIQSQSIRKQLLPQFKEYPNLNLFQTQFRDIVPKKGVLINLKSKKKGLVLFNSILYNDQHYIFQSPKQFEDGRQILDLNLIKKIKNKNGRFSQDVLKQTLVLSSQEIMNSLPQLTVRQAELSVFIPNYLIKRSEKRSKYIFLNQKKLPTNYFQMLYSDQRLKGYNWNTVERLNLSQNQLKSIQEILPDIFPNVASLILNNNFLTNVDFVKLKKWSALKQLYLSNNKIVNLQPIINSFPQLNILDISVNLIQKLPSNMDSLKNLYMLNINHNFIRQFGNSFKKLRNLKILLCKKNIIQQIDDSFCQIRSLTTLSLQQNDIGIVSGMISQLSQLKTLKLSQNCIQSFPQSFGELLSLEKLQIQSLPLLDLPNSFGNLSKLSTLKCSQLNIPELPQTFSRLKQLKIFQVWNSQLSKLPTNFGLLKSLQLLVLSNCSFTQLPESFCQLDQLMILNFSYSKIKNLPEKFGNLKQLTQLYLDFSEIQKLPDSFCELSSLSILGLSKTTVTTLPQNFGNLKALTKLYLMESQIKVLPAGFCGLISLKNLNISKNKLKNLPQDIQKLKSLTQIQMEGSLIQILPQSFGNLFQLSILNISNTGISILPSNLKFRHLKTLKLSNTKLQNLPSSIFKLNTLQCLDISNMKISEIPEEIGNLKQLTVLVANSLQIQALPKSFINLKKLKRLSLLKNKRIGGTQIIQTIKQLKCLQKIEIMIKNVNIQKFQSLEQLQNLKQLTIQYENQFKQKDRLIQFFQHRHIMLKYLQID